MARRIPTIIWCLLAWCAVFGAVPQVGAQPESAPRGATPVRGDRIPTGTADDLRFLRGPDGRLVPVPDKAAYDEFLKWLDAREHPGPPAAAITRIRLEGTPDGDRVQLTARVDVTVSSDDTWVRVPLGMAEAQLTDEVTHAGPGDHTPGAFSPDRGLEWWLRGKGRHELTLKVQIPVGTKGGPRRISLSLPPSAVSSFRMRIAAPRITTKTSDRATLTTRQLDQETDVEVVGLDERLEFAWQPLPPASTAPALLEVNTAVALTLVEKEGVTVEATQRIHTLGQQGTIERVQVRLPEGTELLRLEGPDVLSTQPITDSPGRYAVLLKKPVTGVVELRYTLHAAPPAEGQPFVLDGFDVESASAQSGHVAVTVVGDLRAVRDLENEKFVHRVNVSDLPTSLRQPQTSLAFRYFKRLRLSLHFERVAPLASVEPETAILARPRLLELFSQQRLQIRRGSLTRIMVRWPGRQASGWSLPALELVGGGEVRIVAGSEGRDDLEVESPEPLTGNIVLRIRSQRPLNDPGEDLETSLPVCDVPVAHPAVVTVYATEDLETRLSPLEGTLQRPAPIGSRAPLPEAAGLQRRDDQVIEPPLGRVALQTRRHDRRAMSNSVVDVRLVDRAALVVQRFEIEVEFAPLDELRFLAPPLLDETPVELQIDGRVVVGEGESQAREWIVPVDPPRTGRIVCEARYAIEFPVDLQAEPQGALRVPLLSCETADSTVTQVVVRDAAGVPAAVLGTDWKRQIGPTGTPVWIQAGTVDQLDVSLPSADQRRALDPISRASLRTIVGGDGTIRTRAQYRVAPGIEELVFRLPPGLKPARAWWNSQSVVARFPAEARLRADSWILSAPEAMPQATSVVTIDLEAPAAEIGSLGMDLQLAAPILPADRIPAETVWELSVPEDQYLMNRPAGFGPAYHWTRQGLGWSRLPLYSDAELRAWVGDGLTIPVFEPDGDGHAYLFHTTRGELVLQTRFLNRLPLVLLGSGGVLLAGLLFTRMRWLHSLPVAVAACAAVALAAVGWTETVLILLQPALLGAALLGFYLLVDSLALRGRPAEPPILPTFPPTASTIAPQNPGSGAPGSQDFTAVRPNLAFADSGAKPTDLGSRP